MKQTSGRAIRFIILLGFMLLIASVSLAEQTTLDADAARTLLAAHPGYTISAQTQWGDTAAVVLSENTQHILCVAQKQGGLWTVTIDNPTALQQGSEVPFLLLDTDTVLLWHYYVGNDAFQYRAEKESDGWGAVSLQHLYMYDDNSVDEYSITYSQSDRGGVISRTKRHLDENNNLLYETTDIPIPAKRLASYTRLANFDVDKFPCDFHYIHDWTNPFVRQSAAEQLMPTYRFLGGTIKDDSFEFLMQKPNGDKVFIGVAYNEADGWMLTESTPLPESTLYGHENFSTCLYFPRQMLFEVELFADGTWGVWYLYTMPQDGTEKEMIILGQNWIGESRRPSDTRYFGAHPWNDITAINWSTLPMHLGDAVGLLDQNGWAVVNNPNPRDRLHLRTSPNKSAASLGKYYNGTAVQILENGKTWAKVSVYGVEGYMMKKYLVFGAEMNTVASATLGYYTVSYTAPMYKHPQDVTPFATVSRNDPYLCIIGIIGEEWYHVWVVDSELSGYVRQSDLWPGNG